MLKKPDLMDFLPKQGGATPTPPKPEYKMPVSPLVTEIKKNQDATRAQAEATAKANLEKKQRYNRETVSQLNIKTKYGTAVVPYKGFKALSIDEQRALNSKLKAEIEAKEDAKRKPQEKPKATIDPYNPGEVVPMKSDFEIARDMVNNSQIVQTGLDLSPLRLGGKMLDKAVPNASKRVQDFGKAIQVSTEQKDMGTTGLLAIPEFLGRQAVNIPGQIVEGVGTIMNPKTDNAGVIQAGLEVGANVVPAVASGKAGFAAYRAAKAAGTPALQAIAKGVGTAVADSMGVSAPESPKVQQFKENIGVGDNVNPTAQGWKPIADAGYATNAVETPVTSFMAKEARRNRAVSFSNDLIAEIQKQKSKLRPKSSDYRRLDILEKEIAKGAKSGEFHPLVDDMLNEYDAKMGLSTPAKQPVLPKPVQPESPVVQPADATQAIHPNPKEVRPTDSAPAVLTPEQIRAQAAGTDPTSLRDAEAMAEKLKAPTPDTPSVTSSVPMADLQPNTTGISNAANLSDVESGLLTEVAKGEGKSAKAVYEANRGREDYLEVAKRVRNGAPLNAEDTATLLAGGQKLTKRVYDTREAVKTAIANGADQATITRLNNDYAEARRVKEEFTQDVQRGKSGWSDVGRVLAQKVEVDTGDIAQVMEEARIRKGAELTDKESVVLKKKVAELQANAVESDKRINDLMDQLVKAQEATRVTRRAGMSRVQTASVREQAKTRFTEARSKAKSVASLNALQGITDPDVIKSFKEYVNAVMDDGARSIQDIVDQMAKDGVTADGEDIYKAFTDKTGMRKLSDIQKELSKARREIVKDAVQGPNITPAQKNLRARIAELENQIKTGDYIEAQPKIKREIDAEVYRLQQIKKMKDAQVKDALEQMRPKSKSENLNSLSSELKLLNPVSRLKDVISNTANLTATMVETPVRYAVDRITARVARQDPIMMLKGSRESAGIANDRIAATVKTDLGSAWQGLDASATEKFGFTRGIGGRSAGVTDAPFKTVYREYANVRLAEEKARRILPKNATRGDIQNMRDSILANLDDHPDVKLGAEDIALYKTFNNQNAISKFNAMAKRGLNNDLATGFYDELIGRFSKVITNVNLDRLDRTGFGVVRGFTKLLRNKETLTVAERMIINDMISKGLFGMPIVATGYYMSDKIPAEIKDGYRKYIDRGDLGDIGGVVAAFLYGADMKAAEKEGKDANELRFGTTAGLALDNPMSTNLADLFGLMKDPTASGFVDYAAKKATNLIPGGIRETARRMDEPNMQGVPAMVRPKSGQAKEREKYPRGTKARVNKLSADEKSAQAILDMILGEGKSKLPYLRQTLPEK